MKVAGKLGLLLCVGALAFSCASDIILEEPPSLKGVYQGIYSVTILGDQPVVIKERINWRFDDQQYNMTIDFENPLDPADIKCFCKVFGKYAVEDRVKIRQAQRGEPVPEAGCNTCLEDYDPQGDFALDRSTDTLKLSQLDRDQGLLKEIKLLKVTGESGS